MQKEISITKQSKDYELLDTGEGEKLERFGNVIMSRPDPQALWPKRLDNKEWAKAHAHFERAGQKASWKIEENVPEKWTIEMAGLNFVLKPSSFKHVGIFPEQETNWQWLERAIEKAKAAGRSEISVLNLFGYTGGATLAAAKSGARVTHVDSSKTTMAWATENAEASGLKEKPIRWILDDAQKFIHKEARRGTRYDIIIMDPPSFGHGPKGELWKIEDHLLELFDTAFSLLSKEPIALLVNGYAAGYSSIAYANNLQMLHTQFGGTVEAGELMIEESIYKNTPQRLLPCGIFARWMSQ